MLANLIKLQFSRLISSQNSYQSAHLIPRIKVANHT